MDAHAKCHASLWEEGVAQVFDHVVVATCGLGAFTGTKVFSGGAGEDVEEAYKDDDWVFEDAEVEVGATDDEEEGK